MLRQKGYPCEAEFTDQVTLAITLPTEETEAFIESLVDKSDGTAVMTRLGQSLEAYKPTTAE